MEIIRFSLLGNLNQTRPPKSMKEQSIYTLVSLPLHISRMPNIPPENIRTYEYYLEFELSLVLYNYPCAVYSEVYFIISRLRFYLGQITKISFFFVFSSPDV